MSLLDGDEKVHRFSEHGLEVVVEYMFKQVKDDSKGHFISEREHLVVIIVKIADRRKLIARRNFRKASLKASSWGLYTGFSVSVPFSDEFISFPSFHLESLRIRPFFPIITKTNRVVKKKFLLERALFAN